MQLLSSPLAKYQNQGKFFFKKIFLFILHSFFVEFLLLLFFFIICSIFFTWPAILHFQTYLINDGGDLFLFAMHRVHQALLSLSYPFTSTNLLRYPVGYQFGVGIDAIMALTLGSLLLNWFSPIITYNLVVWSLFTLNAVIAYYFFKALSDGQKILSLAGAVAYGLSFYVLARGAGHLNLAFVAGFPLVMMALFRQIKKIEIVNILLFYLGIWLVSWGSLQYLIILFLFFLVLFLTAACFYPQFVYEWLLKQFNIKNLQIHLLGLTFFLVFFLFPFFPTLKSIYTGDFQTNSRDKIIQEYNISWQNFVIPNPYNYSVVNRLITTNLEQRPNIEKAVFLGYAELLFFIFYLIFDKKQKFKLFTIALLSSLVVLSLGVSEFGIHLPYSWLVKISPFSGLAESGRLVSVILLVMITSIVLFITDLQNNWLRKFLAFLFLTSLIIERINFNYFQVKPALLSVGDVTAHVPGQAVLNLPLDLYRQDYSLIPVKTNKAIVGGYIHWSADTKETKKFIEKLNISRFKCDSNDLISQEIVKPEIKQLELLANEKLLENLIQEDIKTILVHKNDPFYHPQCANVRARLNLLLDNLKTIETTQIGTAHVETIHDGLLKTKLYFPYAGQFKLNGLSVTSTQASISAQLNQQSIPLVQEGWSKKDGLLLFTAPSSQQRESAYQFKVTAGSYLTVSSNTQQAYGAITIWYDFIRSKQNFKVIPSMRIKEIYSTKDLSIYQID